MKKAVLLVIIVVFFFWQKFRLSTEQEQVFREQEIDKAKGDIRKFKEEGLSKEDIEKFDLPDQLEK